MKNNKTNIVSLSQVGAEFSQQVSEFESGLIVANNAYNRWMVRCMMAVGMQTMTATDISLLHQINHKHSQKKLADICFVLNIEDTHVATYSIKKLLKLELVLSHKQGKEVLFSISKQGKDLCERYEAVKAQCLIETLQECGLSLADIGNGTQLLRLFSGLYDQAARTSASL